jgi:hypothetical protein
MTANTALIAGIGTLLLAMGIGVYIGSQGRSDTSGSAKAPAAQTVTVISQGSGAAGGATGTATTPATGPTTGATGTTGSTTAGKKAAATKKATTPAPPKKATPPVVHVGSPGTGPGYQNGKFTGNFF